MRLGREDGVEEEEPSGAGAGVGAGVEEPDPVSSSISCTSSIVISSAIIRFHEIIILARMNYFHVGRRPSWRCEILFCRNWYYTRVL